MAIQECSMRNYLYLSSSKKINDDHIPLRIIWNHQTSFHEGFLSIVGDTYKNCHRMKPDTLEMKPIGVKQKWSTKTNYLNKRKLKTSKVSSYAFALVCAGQE